MAKSKKAVQAENPITTTIEAPKAAEAVKAEPVPIAELPTSSTSTSTSNTPKAPLADIEDDVYEANAYVVAYRSPKARIEALKQRRPDIVVTDEDLTKGEAKITLEGHFEWVKLNFGGVFPGTRLHVTYQKDKTGKIVRSTLIAHKK